MKRILYILLILCLVPVCVMAYDFEMNGVYYNITSRIKRTVEVTHWHQPIQEEHHHHHHDHESEEEHTHQCVPVILDSAALERERTAYIGKVVIPASVRYKGIKYRVTGIGDGSFWGRSKLTEVVLPSGVEYIGDDAFETCPALREVHLPATVTRIGLRAFCGCKSFTEITLPEGVQQVGLFAFEYCDKLTQIQLPATLKSFYGNMFLHCDRLERVILSHTIPPTVENNKGLRMDLSKLVFYVPQHLLTLYQEDEFWCRQDVRIIQ